MPALLHYKGELYFSSYSELEAAIILINKEAPQEDGSLKACQAELKLFVDISAPFSKKDALEKLWNEAATFATSGMVMVLYDEDLEDVICADRENDFNTERPALLMFSLREFEGSFGKLEIDIADVVYDSPFYIYDQSLKKAGPKFADEIPISDSDCRVGFDILKIIWGTHIAKSSTSLL